MATALDDIDLDEEIRRQRAMEALLAPPEAQTQAESDQQPDSAKQDDTPPKKVEDVYGDWRKWPSLSPEEAADIPTIEQQPVPAGHIDLAPPGHIDLAPPTTASAPTPPAGLQTDPDTGQRYVIDPSGQMVPYAEPATEADKQAFKPGDVTLPQVTTEAAAPVQPAPDKLDQVERATLVKLPSQVPPAPGKLTQVERALPAGPKAPGAHTELAPPGQMDLRADTDVVPPPAAQPVATQPAQPVQPAQPAAAPDPNNWKTWTTTDGSVAEPQAVQAVQPASVDTLKAGEGNRVDPVQLYSYLLGKFANSDLVKSKYVPPDGARWGIRTGSAAEWAAFGLAVAKQESDFKARAYNDKDPGGSAGLFQFGQGQTQFTNGVDQFNPQGSADAFVRSVEHYVGNKGNVANLGETFGSIRRPNEAGQYIPYAQEVAAKAPAQGETAPPPQKQDWESWGTLAPAEQATVDKGVNDRQTKILTDIQNSTPSLPAVMRILEQPIKGVDDAPRKTALDDFKKKITAYAQEYYQEPDAAKAYARIMQGPDWKNLWGATTFFGEIGSKFFPNVAHAGLSMAQAATSTDALTQFLNVAQPDASPEARTTLVRQVMAYSGQDRNDFIKHLYNTLTPDQAQNVDLNALLNWSDTVSQPGVQEEQARQQDAIKAAVAQNRKDLRTDPTLQGTLGGTIADSIAAAPKNFAEGIVPGIGQSVMASEIYSDTLDGLRQDHPDWTEDQLKAKAAAVSIPQNLLQELINLGTLGVGGSALRGIENPIARILASSIAHGTIAAGAGAGQQAVSSWAQGKTPTAQELIEAAEGAGVQGLIGGAIGGRHGEEIHPELTPEARPEAEAEPAAPPEPAPRPVARADVLGPEEPTPPAPARPWYMQGAEPGQDPLVIRGAERTTFTPQELSDAIGRMPSGTPEELRATIEKLISPTGLHLGDESTPEIKQAQAVQAVPRPLNVAEAIRQAKADAVAASLGGTTQPVRPATAAPPPEAARPAPVFNRPLGGAQDEMIPPRPGSADHMTGNAGVEEPWQSNIANKYVKERMASGEIGHVEPGTGKTTEELLAQGLKMGPEEINQHMSDIMSGKGDQVAQTAAMRAEEARLSQRSHEASLITEADPTNQQKKIAADNALKDLTDLYNGPMKKLKQNWHRQGVAFQDRIPIDLSTYNGIRSEFIKSTGKTEVPAQAEAGMRKAARQVRESSDNLKAAMKNVGDEAVKNAAEKKARGRKIPSIDQISEDVMRIMGHDPCPA